MSSDDQALLKALNALNLQNSQDRALLDLLQANAASHQSNLQHFQHGGLPGLLPPQQYPPQYLPPLQQQQQQHPPNNLQSRLDQLGQQQQQQQQHLPMPLPHQVGAGAGGLRPPPGFPGLGTMNLRPPPPHNLQHQLYQQHQQQQLPPHLQQPNLPQGLSSSQEQVLMAGLLNGVGPSNVGLRNPNGLPPRALPPYNPLMMQQQQQQQQQRPQQQHQTRPTNLGGSGYKQMPKADLAHLDRALNKIAADLLPTPEELSQLHGAFEQVKAILLKRWPEGNVILFGSVANGLSVRSSNDIDVCLELASVGTDVSAKSEVAVIIGEILEAAGMQDVLPLPKARVPVVKFVVPNTGTKVDITVNNTLACINTKLLSDYCAIDGRLRLLVAIVKHWAKQRSVNDPYRGTLSSYCYVLMCIHLLQQRSPPVLPVLQQLPHTFSRDVGAWQCSYCDAVDVLSGFGSANQENLASLVWAFFEYWAWKHDYANGVVSIRTGGVISKDSKGWTKKIGTERHLLCVEDPFELSHDLGRTVDRDTRTVMRKEFMRAASILRDSEDPLPELFEMYKQSSK